MLHSERKVWSRSLGIGESGRKNRNMRIAAAASLSFPPVLMQLVLKG